MTAAALSPTQDANARRRRVIAPTVLSFIAAILIVAGFGLGAYLPNLHNGLLAATFTAVGGFVLTKRPGHREGWLFLGVGLAHAVMFFGRQYGFAASEGADLPAANWVLWIGVWPLALVLVLVGVTFMCFPDGRLPSRRWRLVVAAMTLAGAGLAILSALWPVEYDDNSVSLPYPFDIGGYATAQRVWDIAGPICYLLFQVIWLTCVVWRLRRAEGIERRQLRWFAYAVVMAAVAMVVSLAVLQSPVIGLLAVPAIPIAAGVAIVRHHLYDIDLVINKTLVVGVMAAIVTAGYVAVVVVIGSLIGVGIDSPGALLPLVATALVGIAFEPARRRVQAWADRLVYGTRPTPYEALSRLSVELSHSSRDADLFRALASGVAEGVGADEVTLWVGTADELVPVASWPPAAREANVRAVGPTGLAALGADGRTHVRPVEHQGSVRGAVTLTKLPGEPLTRTEDQLLGDLVAQAGLVIDHVGLGAELQRRLQQISVQAAELRAAARRIVAAQDDARMRIERDLHDGAQQRLVTLALSLRSLSECAKTAGADDLATGADTVQRELAQALAELRDLARGIHPAVLTQDGLEAAVSSLGERSPLPVRVDFRLDGRLPQDVEATAYFVISEALTNAVKHAEATGVTVTGCLADGQMRIEISDDGQGGADGRWGSGLQGMADRLATLDGRLTVSSPASGGTRLIAALPCE
jgi:signal transduction histidine kinase